jgi:predicted Zn-dependent protease
MAGRHSDRRRWILALLLAAACKGGSPAGLDDEVPIYGACDVQPTYVTEVSLNRWRSFPLAYFFDAASFPAEFLEDYRPAITDGIRRWDEATANELGAVVEVSNRTAADFVITYREFTPALATARVVHSTGTPFLSGGEIQYNPTGMREGEDLVREGSISRQTFLRGISGIAAHEMGHLLGIIGHSTRTDVLMGPTFHDAPSIADVNTLIRAYCHT